MCHRGVRTSMKYKITVTVNCVPKHINYQNFLISTVCRQWVKCCQTMTACACLKKNHSSWLKLALFLQLSNEMQLNLMDMVKSGKLSIDEAVNQARSGTIQKQRNLDLEVQYGIYLKLTFMLNEDLQLPRKKSQCNRMTMQKTFEIDLLFSFI